MPYARRLYSLGVTPSVALNMREKYSGSSYPAETDISETVDCRDYFRDPWQYAVSCGDHRYEFTPEYHFLYLIAHLAKHVAASGAGARMYLDLAAFILHFGEKADWTWIASELEKTGLSAFANTALTFVERYFGVESPLELRSVGADTLEALADLAGAFGGERRISLCRELSKLHEEVVRTTLAEAVEKYEQQPPKGEFVLVVEGAPPVEGGEVTMEEGLALVETYREEGMSLKEASRRAAAETGLNRKGLYDAALGK